MHLTEMSGEGWGRPLSCNGLTKVDNDDDDDDECLNRK